jgi:uncharacterized protein (TIGR02300 family)
MAIRRKFRETLCEEFALVKPEWGAKHLCENCGAKFYDLLRDPAICPKCDTKVSTTARPRRGRGVAPKVEAAVSRPAEKAKEEALTVDDDELLDSDEDDDVEDDSLLEDEDEYGADDIPVVGGIDDDEKDA